ncbi:hypothetical protein PCE1_003429 [Barthelona sp. PCE]
MPTVKRAHISVDKYNELVAENSMLESEIERLHLKNAEYRTRLEKVEEQKAHLEARIAELEAQNVQNVPVMQQNDTAPVSPRTDTECQTQ